MGELRTAYLLRVLGFQIKDVKVGDKLYRLNIFDTVSRQSFDRDDMARLLIPAFLFMPTGRSREIQSTPAELLPFRARHHRGLRCL